MLSDGDEGLHTLIAAAGDALLLALTRLLLPGSLQ